MRKLIKYRPDQFKRIEETYKPNILEDSEEIYELKKRIQNLEEVDKIIILLYTELRSYDKLSKLLGISKSTLYWKIKDIRSKLQ